MLWGVKDRYVGEVIAVYGTRDEAVGALRKMVRDEPEWEGMMEIVPVPLGASHWQPKGRPA